MRRIMMKKLFAISCCMVFLLIASNAFADIVYRVKKGDTLFSISRQFDVSIEEIKRANNLTSSRLRAGVKLTIPIASYVNVSHINENQEEASVDNGSAAHLSQEEIDKLVKSEDLQEMNLRDRVILFAKKMLGMPYRFGGNSSSGIDCSAYVQKVFRFVGIELPRTAREQFRAGESISKEELSVGDLVFFRTYASFPSHVGIYLGNNLFIHASTGDRKVTITSLDTPYFVRRFIGAKRLIPEMY
jgi:cell wall-associated NlpC family hydrolase